MTLPAQNVPSLRQTLRLCWQVGISSLPCWTGRNPQKNSGERHGFPVLRWQNLVCGNLPGGCRPEVSPDYPDRTGQLRFAMTCQLQLILVGHLQCTTHAGPEFKRLLIRNTSIGR